jgi:hypothetical protein
VIQHREHQLGGRVAARVDDRRPQHLARHPGQRRRC